MVSSLTERGKEITMQALEAGAVDFVTKPSTDIARGLNGMMMIYVQRLKLHPGQMSAHGKISNISLLRLYRQGTARWLNQRTK